MGSIQNTDDGKRVESNPKVVIRMMGNGPRAVWETGCERRHTGRVYRENDEAIRETGTTFYLYLSFIRKKGPPWWETFFVDESKSASADTKRLVAPV